MLEKIKGLGVLDYTIVDDNIWFVCSWYNYLFCLDWKTKIVKDAIRIPIGNAICNQRTAMLSLYQREKNIYVLPNGREHGAARFDIKNRVFTFMDTPFALKEWGEGISEDDNHIYVAIKNENRIAKINKDEIIIGKMNFLPIILRLKGKPIILGLLRL